MIAILVYAAQPAAACSIPVFRYALERWMASPYEIVVFRHGELSRGETATLESAGKALANIEIRTVDLRADIAEEDQELWKAQEKTGDLPWVVVRFPGSDAKSPIAWSGKLSREGLLAALESPARRELARRLMAGDSGVWVVLSSDDKESDDRLEKTLVRELGRLEKTMTLPEIAVDGPQLRSSLPLKLKFSVLRVARDDPREAALVRMLRVAEPELAQSDEALVVPVIGRGRAVSALMGSRADEERIGAFAEFICGQCSCEVKDLNPGIDLLMTANWDLIFEEGRDPAIEETPRGAPGKRVAIAGPSPATVPVLGKEGGVVVVERRVESPVVERHEGRKWRMAGIALAAVIVLLSGVAVFRGRRI